MAVKGARKSSAEVQLIAQAGSAAPQMQNHLEAKDVPDGLLLAGITRGYRIGGNPYECFFGKLGLFTWHNQTLNSWTMIGGWMVSTLLLAITFTVYKPTGGAALAFLALWVSPTIHLPFTVGYHQLLSISPQHLRYWRSLDLLFIFVASVPLAFSLAYFVFPLSGTLATTAVTAALAVHAWHYSHMLPAGKEIDKKRNTSYVGVAIIVYMSPILYRAVVDGLAHGGATYSVWCACAASLCLAYAAVVYIAGYPDVYLPGCFDYVGSAQQLMHMGIAGAHVCEWFFLWHRYQELHHHHQHAT